MNLVSVAKELVRSAEPYWMAQWSFGNYHAVGLDYLCLLRDPRFTVKAYFFREDRKETGHKDWLVWPHNHRYRFEHVTLAGGIVNRRFYLTSSGMGENVDIYAFDPSTKKPSRIGESGLFESVIDKSGRFQMPDTNELHTLSIDTPTAVGLQVQYHDERDHTMMVSARGAEVKCHDNGALYLKISEDRASRWLEELKAVL